MKFSFKITGLTIFVIGIGMCFFVETKHIAPLPIGFGLGMAAANK